LVQKELRYAGGLAASFFFVVAACSAVEENQPGNFSALAYGVKAPGLEKPPATATTCPGVAVDSATTPTQDAASDASSDAKDAQSEAAVVVVAPDNCKTIFVDKIVPYLQGSCSGCHTAPLGGSLNLSADKGTWRDDLVAAQTTSSLKLPYVNVCTTDPQQHPMYCNIVDCADLSKTGGNAMPKYKPDPRLAPEEKVTLEAWIKCGSPK
jgi:hypothetical protein